MEALDIGSHSGVDRGIEFAQQRHQAVTYLVAAGIGLTIGAILDIQKGVLFYITRYVGPAERQ